MHQTSKCRDKQGLEEKMALFVYNLDVGKPKHDSKFRYNKEKIDKFNPMKLFKNFFSMNKKKTPKQKIK